MYGHEKSAGCLTSALIEGIQFVKCVCPLPKNLDFTGVCGSVVMNTRTKNHRKSGDYRRFSVIFVLLDFFYPLSDPLTDGSDGHIGRSKGHFQELPHFFSGVLLHLFCNMGISVQSEPGGELAQHVGQDLDVHPILQGDGRERMPIWYNCDNTVKPNNIRGLRIFKCSFSMIFEAKKRRKGGVEFKDVTYATTL